MPEAYMYSPVSYRNAVRTCFALIFILLTASCGSGSGSGGSQNEAPVVAINPDDIDLVAAAGGEDGRKFLTVQPSTWPRAFNDEGNVLFGFAEPFENDTDLFRESIIFIQASTLSEIRNFGLDEMAIASTRPTRVAEFPAVEETITGTIDGFPLRSTLTYFAAGGKFYGILYIAEESQFRRNELIALRVADETRIKFDVLTGLDRTSDLHTPGQPAVATDGEKTLVTACVKRSDENFRPNDLVASLYNHNNQSAEPFTIVTGSGPLFLECRTLKPSVIFDGINYLVVFVATDGDQHGVYGLRVSRSGEVVDSAPIFISANGEHSTVNPSVAFDGQRTLVTWHEIDRDFDKLMGAFVDIAGVATAPFIINDSLTADYPQPRNSTMAPVVTYGDGRYLVAWSPHFFNETDRTSAMDIRAQLLDLSGAPQLASSVLIRSDTGDTNPRYLQTLFNGTNFVIAWVEGALHSNIIDSGSFTLVGKRVTGDGRIVDGGPDAPGLLIAGPRLEDPFFENNDQVETSKTYLRAIVGPDSLYFVWRSSGRAGGQAVRTSFDLSETDLLPPLRGVAFEQPGLIAIDNVILSFWSVMEGKIESWWLDGSAED